MCCGQDIPALPDQVCQLFDHETDTPKTSRIAAIFLSPVQTLNDSVAGVCREAHDYAENKQGRGKILVQISKES